MKEVLISIQPKWCKLIANGQKTIEVRKTKPKLDTPFKCYIYETKAIYKNYDGILFTGEGKVIGEFVCDNIFPMSITYSDLDNHVVARKFPNTCLTDKQIIEYLGNGKRGYGWHISNLKIYDKPKELSEFGLSRPPQSWCYVESIVYCKDCKHLMFSDCYAECEKAYKGIVSIDNFCDKGELK